MKLKLFCCFCCIACCYGNPYNGGCEILGPGNSPHGWAFENDVECATYLQPWEYIANGGNPGNWRFPVNTGPGLLPFKGDRMFLLTTNAIETTSICKRPFIAGQGTSLRGQYFFGSNDYLRYNDYGALLLIPLDPNSEMAIITVFEANVSDVGDYSSYGNWKRFQHDFTSEEIGVYQMILIVEDEGDNIYDSFLAVDSMIVCFNDTGRADLNCDCTVDFTDVAILMNDWQVQCLDPYADCLGGTDLDNDGIVNFDDLTIMLEEWSNGERTTQHL